MTTLVVLQRHPDGKHGLLNIVESGDEHEARRLAQGWQSTMPYAVITVKQAYADKCRPVNNHDGFPDKEFA